jgi:hypothetical protein
MHEISLKTAEPIYVKQFKIPGAHQKEVEQHILKLLKLGVMQPAKSRYTSPLFDVIKKMATCAWCKTSEPLTTSPAWTSTR